MEIENSIIRQSIQNLLHLMLFRNSKNIHNILDHIKRSYIAIRINFDQDTLNDFDSILEELQAVDRKRTKVILKKFGK